MSSISTEPIKTSLKEMRFFHGHTTRFAQCIADRLNCTISPEGLVGEIDSALCEFSSMTPTNLHNHPLVGLNEIHYNQIYRDIPYILEALPSNPPNSSLTQFAKASIAELDRRYHANDLHYRISSTLPKNN